MISSSNIVISSIFISNNFNDKWFQKYDVYQTVSKVIFILILELVDICFFLLLNTNPIDILLDLLYNACYFKIIDDFYFRWF